MEKFDAWLNQIHHWEDQFDYRAIYSAYLNAAGGTESESIESTCRRRPDGGYEIYAGRETIALADDIEREALAAHIAHRYCGDRYPDMEAWHWQQHDWYVEDLRAWTSADGWSSQAKPPA
ncbi:hypothetical protein [Nocardia arthritidis]|uniref:Uncharacterized protein n=1 Tax=Nocardia arthritidis TaxID=228602 RepID=A0A6G9YT70_9NOCA|nr:hypothetical protein [Nocardia arthritidis]QIS16093.1 hypothetical protein F5544_41415 [Nocardia arthritidis]